MKLKASTERFSDRVENYVKYRPSYPREVLGALSVHCGLTASSIVADVGSGTGIFSTLLLQTGCRVFAVEPNAQMRGAAEEHLSSNPGFHSVSGTAEATGLAKNSVDIITAAQSFHWFRKEEIQAEFWIILNPDGWVALIWNQRRDDSPFQMAYDALLCKHAPEYSTLNHRNINEDSIATFLGRNTYEGFTFQYSQQFDFGGLKGRMLSSSYTPCPDAPGFGKLMQDLKEAFEEHAHHGQVIIEYETQLHLGRIDSEQAVARDG
jgi:SAM-dependent methyltransferase